MPLLVNTVSRLVDGALAHVEIAAGPPVPLCSQPDCWRRIVEPTGRSIVMKGGLSYYFFELKEHMRHYCAEKNLVVSEAFIDKQIVNLLIDSKASCTGLPDIAAQVKNWIADISKTEQHDYTIMLPINQCHFRGEVSTPRMKIVKITDEKINENMRSLPDFLRDRLNAKELADENETDTFAIASTRANDTKSAVELATAMVDRFVYAVKLIDPNATVSSRRNARNVLLMSYLTYNASKAQLGTSLERVNELPFTIQSGDFYDKFNKPWMRLLDFLFSDHPTDLEKSIIDALYWYGEVDAHRDSLVSQYLYYLIGLEKLLVPNYKQQKAKKFGNTAAVVFHGNADHADFYEEYYKKRNMLVHGGPVTIYKEDADSLRLWLRSILLDLVNNTDKYIDLESYYKGIHCIEW